MYTFFDLVNYGWQCFFVCIDSAIAGAKGCNALNAIFFIIFMVMLSVQLVRLQCTQKYAEMAGDYFGFKRFNVIESTLFINFVLIFFAFYCLIVRWWTFGWTAIASSFTPEIGFNIFGSYVGIDKLFFLDGLSFIFVFLTVLIIPLCIIISSTVSFKLELLVKCLVAIEILLILAFSTSNFFVFYVAFEAVLIPMYFIIGLWGSRSERTFASYLFFLYTLAGSVFFFVALMIINIHVGSFDFNTMVNSMHTLPWETKEILWICLVCGFAFKVPLYPVHSWLTVAHVEAPTCGSVILASLMLKLGGYGLTRFVVALLPDVTIYYQAEAVAVCLCGFVYATVVAYRQLDLKRFVAYTSIAHMHFIVLSLLTLTDVGYWGAVHNMISHGFISSALFILVGSLYDRFGVRIVAYYAGLADQMPLFAFFWTVFLFANAGIPFFSGFPGEFCGFIAVFTMNPVVGFLLSYGFLMGIVYTVLMITRVIHGSPSIWFASKQAAPDLLDHEVGVLVLLLVWVFALGIWPEMVISLLKSNIMF